MPVLEQVGEHGRWDIASTQHTGAACPHQQNQYHIPTPGPPSRGRPGPPSSQRRHRCRTAPEGMPLSPWPPTAAAAGSVRWRCPPRAPDPRPVSLGLQSCLGGPPCRHAVGKVRGELFIDQVVGGMSSGSLCPTQRLNAGHTPHLCCILAPLPQLLGLLPQAIDAQFILPLAILSWCGLDRCAMVARVMRISPRGYRAPSGRLSPDGGWEAINMPRYYSMEFANDPSQPGMPCIGRKS